MNIWDAIWTPRVKALTKRWLGTRKRSAFFTSAPIGLAVLNSDLRIIHVNERMANVLGMAVSDIVGKSPRVVAPLLAPAIEPILRRVSTSHMPALNFPVSGEAPDRPGVTRRWVASAFPLGTNRRRPAMIGAIAVDVTEPVQFDELAKRQSMLEQGEELASLGSWEHDCTSGMEFWSSNLCRMLGHGQVGHNVPENAFWELVHPDDRGRIHETLEWAMRMGEPYEYEARMNLPDGREHIFLTRGKVVVDAKKRAVKRLGVSQDITIRVEIERELKRSEERYRDLVENSEDLICTHDMDGRILTMNERPAQILGYAREFYIGRLIPDMLGPQFRSEFFAYMSRITRDGEASGLMPVTTRNGQQRIWEYHNTIRKIEGHPWIVRGMAHDVTEREEREKTLRLYKNLVDHSNELFEVFDTATLQIVEVNQTVCSALDYTRGELLRMTTMDIDETLDRETVKRLELEASQAGSTVHEGLHHRRNGSTFPVEITLRRVGLGDGRLAAVVRDMAERKCLENALSEEIAKSNGLSQLTHVLPHMNDLQSALDELALRAISIIKCQSGCAVVCSKERFICGAYFLDGTRRDSKNFLVPDFRIPEWVIENKQTYLANDFQFDQLTTVRVRDTLSLENILCAPVFDAERSEVIALLALVNKKGGFSERDLETVETISGIASATIRNVLSQQRIQSLESELQQPAKLDATLQMDRVPARRLQPAIEEFVRNFEKRTGISTVLEQPDTPIPLTRPQVEAALVVLKECLTNIQRHSGSSAAIVRVQTMDGQFVMEVIDLGKGFSREYRSRVFPPRLGINFILGHARQVGGTVRVDSYEGKGTTVRLSVPLKAQSPDSGVADAATA